MTTTASTFDLKEYVAEVIKCPICLEDINKQRMLPCFHTYCLDCIITHSKDKLPGDDVECPICRKRYLITDDGFEQLPHNFVIDGLVEAKKVGDTEPNNNSDACTARSDDVPFTEEDKPVDGVTILDNELYVSYAAEPDIAVYDKETFSLQRRLPVDELGRVNDMASCKRFKCIYIADYANKVVHRYEKANGEQTKWCVDDVPHGLSVNSEYSVIVTFCEVHKVKVFTTQGELVKVINLQSSHIKYPWHTIQLSTDKYVVSHGGALNRVIVVNGSGHDQLSFGRERGSNEDQLHLPMRFAVVKNGFVLVADGENKRLIMLSTVLRYAKSWSLSGWPLKMWFDEETNRLYVAVNKWNDMSEGWTSGKVEVYSVSCC